MTLQLHSQSHWRRVTDLERWSKAMRATFRVVIVSSLIFGACALSSALACSVPHVATAAEITAAADVILLVRVPDVTITNISSIEMIVVEVVKGEFKSKTVIVHGQTVRYDGPNDGTVPYDFVRPGGLHGDCYASDYKAGGQFLLFLRGGDVHWSPLAATNEEVSGPKDHWVVWVRDRLKAR